MLAAAALMAAVMLSLSLTAYADNPPPIQTYYVLLPEEQVLNSLVTLYSGTDGDIHTVISIAPVADGTVIYYDQWENGYEPDIAHPTDVYDDVTNPDGVQIWGDGDQSNGFPPNIPGDVIGAGDVIVLENNVPADPRDPADIFFDGQDKFAVSKPVAVTRAAWANTPGAVLAGAVEVYDTSKYGTSFEAPVGEDIPSDSMFEYTSLLVEASEDNTTVQIDWDADGTVDATVTLDEGESYQVSDSEAVNAGATVTASAPVQVHMVTGDIDTRYESRWYALLPIRCDSYYGPVSTRDTDPTDVFVYNPNASPITVEWETDAGTQTALTVPAGGAVRQRVPDGSGVHFYTTDGSEFLAIATVDSDSENSNFDWGFALVPERLLTSQALIGWGPGADTSSPVYLDQNGSPVWVTPLTGTTVYVDYDGDPTTGPFTDPEGNQYDVSYALNALQRQRIFDSDGDQTGMLLYTLDGTRITAAWGQDPSAATPSNPYLDMGTTVPPLVGFAAGKDAALVNDADGDGQADPGDTLVYTITVQNISRVPVPDVVVSDTVPLHTGYVANSTEFDDGTTVASVPDAGGTPFPLDEGGVTLGTLPVRGVFTVTFQVTIDDPLPAGVESVVNQATVSAMDEVVVSEVETPVAIAPLLEAEKSDTLFVDADGDGMPSPGDTLLYEITIVNSGNGDATGVAFSDTPDPNTTLVVGSVQTSQGTVTSGNGAGDTSVAVDVGTILSGGSVNIRFEVIINNPLPAGVTQVANHGLVSSNELPEEPTDDPDTLPDDDETVTPVTAAPVLEADKRDELFVDADGNGMPSPGDTLLYRITIANSGNGGATGVTFSDIPDPNTTLVVGSVQTSQGMVTSGNVSGDTSVAVDVGTIPSGGSVDITFQVIINNPLPAGVTQVANHGLVSSNELPVEPTDDLDTLPDDDETVTPVTAAPVLEATKRDTLFTDADGNGLPSPGDTLLYRITIVNSGNAGATGVTFSDTLDPNTTLVVGSVQTSQGTVTSGNAAGDTSVAVDIGTIVGGGSVDITFRVLINDPLPPDVTQVANQGLVSSNELPDEPTDDPDTLPDDDETVTPVAAVPSLEAYKTDDLFIDADSDGLPSPGDTLLYRVTIVNTSNVAVTGVTFSDTPDPNTALVVGSVQTSQGTVTSGNNPGDTTIVVDIGTIPSGGTVDISLQVTVNDPLPGGVNQVSNQGVVSSDDLPDVPTDDPTTIEEDDDTPTAVELLYFRVGGVAGHEVRLEWATAVEIDNFGFNLYRALVADISRATLFAFVPSQARGGGATYVYEDTVPADGLWWYWLADVDTSGYETFHGPVSAGVGVNAWSHRVYLPLVMR